MTKTPKISYELRAESYQYFIEHTSIKQLKRKLKASLGSSELLVIKCVWEKKIDFTLYELIFIDYCYSSTYRALVKKYKISHREVAKAINGTRLRLIEEIKELRKQNMLPPPFKVTLKRKLSKSELLNDWNSHMNTLGLNSIAIGSKKNGFSNKAILKDWNKYKVEVGFNE